MHSMSWIMVNAVKGAIGYDAYLPEKVLSTVLRLVPDIDNVSLHMIKRHMDSCEWHFGCPHSKRICTPIAEELLAAVDKEIEERRKLWPEDFSQKAKRA